MTDQQPKVYNKRQKGVPADAVYVGRPTKWGNAYSHKEGTKALFKVATVDEAVSSYRSWLLGQPELILEAKAELRGKHLVCWCVPHHDCHARILLEIANAP